MNRIAILMRVLIAALLLLPQSITAAGFKGAGAGEKKETSRIGAAGGVQGKVLQTADMRKIVGKDVLSGAEMWLYDKIQTNANSRLQILLKDQTVFTLGPSAEMTLDEFVYDPKTNSGAVHAEITKGAFRFVTGKIAGEDPANMSIKVPSGTIGIRGTVGVGKVEGKKTTMTVGGPGEKTNTTERIGGITLTNEFGSQTLTRPGFFSEMEEGKAPTPPKLMPPSLANELYDPLTSKPGQKSKDGGGDGATTPPSGGGTSGNTASNSAAEGQNAGENSGNNTAGGLANAGDEKDAADLSAEMGRTTTEAQQTQANHGVGDGIAQWDIILANVPSGQGYYFSGDAGGVSCTGCFSTPQAALQLQIDFGARTVGGTGILNPTSGSNQSFIHLHNVTSSADTVQQSINSISFASLSGAATLVLKNSPTASNDMQLGSLTGGYTGAGFNGTTITLYNSDGIAANSAKTNLTYTATNTATVTATASGTFDSPLYK
ncbi:MAG: FecR domain-containing protein [Elusimicrobia bacterium]|nr:FecR domain-containing protein [Elusimicrobiota bacterium]